jgi:hypothetical protein
MVIMDRLLQLHFKYVNTVDNPSDIADSSFQSC